MIIGNIEVAGLIKSASTEAIIKILNAIQKNHKLTTLEEFGIRVAIKKLKETEKPK